MVGHLPDEKFKQLVSSQSLKNCCVKVNDITNDRDIFGPYLPGLGWITTRQKPGMVEPVYIGIPSEIYERKKNVHLMADVMFVNGLAFMVTFSRKNRLFTAEYTLS